MRIAILTAEEAANPEVMKNLAEYFLDGEVATRPAVVDRRLAAIAASVIDPADDPSTGAPEPLNAEIQERLAAIAEPVVDTLSLFGAPAAILPPALPAPPAAVAAPSPIAPVAPQVSGQASTITAPVQLLAPEAPAQPAPAPPAASAVAGQRDATGLPWDGRIHASSQTLTAEGAWRKKRGVEPEEMAAVEADLRVLLALPPAPAAPRAPTLQHPGEDFTQFSLWISSLMIAGKVSVNDIASAVSDSGLKSLPDLMHRADLIPVVRARFEQLVASR